MSIAGVLQAVVAALEKAEIPHLLTGSLAAAFHGAGRATMDVALVIDPTLDSLRALVASFPPNAYYVSLEAALEARVAESQFNVIDLESGWKVDLIVRKSRPFSRVEFERRTKEVIEGAVVSVASVEDVLLSKLEWARLGDSGRQVEDAAALLRIRGPDLDLPYLRRWIDVLGLEPQWEVAKGLSIG
jgi:hypothetical protein